MVPAAPPADPVLRSAVGKVFRHVLPLFVVMLICNQPARATPSRGLSS